MSMMSKGKYGDDSKAYMQQEIDELKAELEKSNFLIACHESGGVDNWPSYSDSLQPYWEKYET